MATNKKKEFVCDICGEVRHGYSSIISHVRRAHGIMKRGYHHADRAPVAPPSTPQKLIAQENQIKFCPCCGFNLFILNSAMNLANKIG